MVEMMMMRFDANMNMSGQREEDKYSTAERVEWNGMERKRREGCEEPWNDNRRSATNWNDDAFSKQRKSQIEPCRPSGAM